MSKVIAVDIVEASKDTFNVFAILLDKQEGCLFRKEVTNISFSEVHEFIEKEIIPECIQHNCKIIFENNSSINCVILMKFKEYLIGEKVHYFKNIHLKDYLNESINFTELCLKQLLDEEFTTYTLISGLDEEPVYTTSSDWTYEDNIQNWLHESKPYRVTVDAILHNKTVLSNNDYEILTDELFVRHKDFIIYNEKAIILYVDGLLPAEISVVQNYLNEDNYPNTPVKAIRKFLLKKIGRELSLVVVMFIFMTNQLKSCLFGNTILKNREGIKIITKLI
jgi:hypothetical protein